MRYNTEHKFPSDRSQTISSMLWFGEGSSSSALFVYLLLVKLCGAQVSNLLLGDSFVIMMQVILKNRWLRLDDVVLW